MVLNNQECVYLKKKLVHMWNKDADTYSSISDGQKCLLLVMECDREIHLDSFF